MIYLGGENRDQSTNMSQFSPYAWQRAQMQRLQDAIDQQRLPHAILFSGPEGVGKRHLANCLVYLALKKHALSDKFEKLLNAGSHPDVMVISPAEDKKQISVDQVRDLSARLSLTSQVSGIKIALINPAELMTVAAANALLKTLEEPSGNTLIILITHNYGRLSQTVRSRCHHVPLTVPDTQAAGAWLREQGIDDYQEYLLLTHGAPLSVRQAAENAWLEHHHQLLKDLTGLMEQRADMVTITAKWRDADAAQLIRWLQNLVGLLVKSRFNDEITSDISGNFLKNLKISFDRIDLKKLINYAEFLDKSALEIDNNLNRELFLEQIFSRWAVLAA